MHEFQYVYSVMESINYHDLFGDFIEKLKSKVTLHSVVLFGSHARGDFHKYSDYDILIIADFEQGYLDRKLSVIKFAPFVSIDLFCYTPEEFDALFSNYNITTLDAVKEGIILFGESYLKSYKLKYEDYVRRGLKKTSCVIIPPSSP